MATAIVLGSLGSAGVVAVVAATPSAAATCTDTWQGPTTGTTSWNASSSNWSSGFPTSTSVVCIGGTTSYTVDLTASATVGGLQLGGTAGTQTLKVDGALTNVDLSFAGSSSGVVASTGVLSLVSSPSGYSDISGPPTALVTNSGSLTATTSASGSQPVYVEVPLTNAAGGTVSISAPETRQDNGTLTTNSGAFTVASGGHYAINGGGFTDAAGTVTLTGTMIENGGTFTQSGGTESGNPLQLTGVTLADSAGTGSFDVVGSSTFGGSIPTGQTVTVDGSSTNVNLAFPSAATVHGQLTEEASPSGYAQINGAGGVTVASGATLTTTTSASSSQPVYIETAVTNLAGGTFSVLSPDTRQDDGTLTTNSGAFAVASGGHYAINGGGFTDAAGTVTLTGTMIESGGTFTQSGGTESGNPLQLTGVTLTDSAGTGSFDVVGSSTFGGSIPTGQTVTVDGSLTNVNLAFPSAATVHGQLTEEASPSGFAQINGAGGVTVASGATLTTTTSASSSQPVYIETAVTNQAGGTVSVVSPDTRQDDGTLTTNSGAFTVASGGHYAITGGGFTDAAGATVTLTGTMIESGGTFTQSGGTESGNPLQLTGVTLTDSAGTGSFDVVGSSTFGGSIPTGQTVTVDGSLSNVNLAFPNAVTDKGQLTMKATPSGFAQINGSGGLTVASGGVLSTTAAASSQPVYIETAVTNQVGGTITIAASDTRQDDGTTTANAGTFQVTNGGHYSLTGALTSTSSSVLGVTVNGTSGSGGISGSGLALNGTLSVTTVGSPAVNTLFTPITGPVTGTFSTFSFGSDDYAVTYPSGAVQLQVEPAFTTTATPLAPKENIALTNPQVASIGSANDGTGTYSATVNYGDGSGVQTASVAVTGPNGTVTGPTHTYTTPGTYTVTATVSNTDGQTNTTSESVTVTGPVVTGFSKTEIKQSKSLTTVISGSGLDSSAVVTTNNSGITVVSVKAGKVSKKHPNPTLKLKLKASATAPLGPVSVTITETGGTVTVANALTVVVK